MTRTKPAIQGIATSQQFFFPSFELGKLGFNPLPILDSQPTLVNERPLSLLLTKNSLDLIMDLTAAASLAGNAHPKIF
jgi:hypothetical protein